MINGTEKSVLEKFVDKSDYYREATTSDLLRTRRREEKNPNIDEDMQLWDECGESSDSDLLEILRLSEELDMVRLKETNKRRDRVDAEVKKMNVFKKIAYGLAYFIHHPESEWSQVISRYAREPRFAGYVLDGRHGGKSRQEIADRIEKVDEPAELVQKLERDVREGDLVRVRMEGIKGDIKGVELRITGHAILKYEAKPSGGDKALSGFALTMFLPDGGPGTCIDDKGILYEHCYEYCNGETHKLAGYLVMERDKYSKHTLEDARKVFNMTGRKTY